MFMYHGLYGLQGLFWPIAVAIAIIPFWRICDRVGLSPWLSLLLLIPLANIVFIYYLAFADWPGRRDGTAGAPPGFGPSTGPGPGSTPT
jgi:hypothetical protein